MEREEGVGHSAQGDVVMESSPRSTFEVVQADFALEFLVVTFDAPA
jgi:hypothetical protein